MEFGRGCRHAVVQCFVGVHPNRTTAWRPHGEWGPNDGAHPNHRVSLSLSPCYLLVARHTAMELFLDFDCYSRC
jgi:hypothetical protein